MDVDLEVMDIDPEVANVENVENDFNEKSALDPEVPQKLQELRTLHITITIQLGNLNMLKWMKRMLGLLRAAGEEVVMVAGNFSEDEELGSGCEEDRVVSENSDFLRGISETLSLRKIRNDNNSYCANVSLVDGNERKLCFFCFRSYRQWPQLQFGKDEHIQDHYYKTKVEFDRYKERCYLCEMALYKIHMTTVCVTCRHHKR